MNEVLAEWEQLCKEHDAARDAYFLACGPVNQKFRQIFQGTSHTNPSDDELSQLEAAEEAWEDVKRRMKKFIKAHVKSEP